VNGTQEAPSIAARPVAEVRSEPRTSSMPLRTLLALPLSAAVALAIHLALAGKILPPDARSYSILLGVVLGLSILGAALQYAWSGLQRWMRDTSPILAAAFALLTVWEVVTVGLSWLPMPYFPGPAGVLQSLINDRALIFDSTWHSLLLLLGGYTLGVAMGLVTGVCIGWFDFARYWGMPVLKVVGPIPATAWSSRQTRRFRQSASSRSPFGFRSPCLVLPAFPTRARPCSMSRARWVPAGHS
jgi:NitT/TauT family transport system permease protein